MTPLSAADAAEHLFQAAESGRTGALAVVVGAAETSVLGRRILVTRDVQGREDVHGGLGRASLDAAVTVALREAVGNPRSRDGLRQLRADDGEVEVYIEIRRAVPELIVVGAGHIALPMAHVGALLGFRVTVLDDRPEFATRERFPDAERVLRADFSDPFADVRLHERSHLLLVTRGHKYDYDCLVRALRADPPPAYIGMIGSRRRVRATYVQLVDEGFDRSAIERIHAPVGLDVGAETPEEIAIAVAAELILLRRGGTGAPLRGVERVAERFFGGAEEEE